MFIAVLVGVTAAAAAALVLLALRKRAGSSRRTADARRAEGTASTRGRAGNRSGGSAPAPASASAKDAAALVCLREVIEEMIEIGEEQTAFLDRVNGELVTLDDEIRLATPFIEATRL